jgi:ketopantoate reductase
MKRPVVMIGVGEMGGVFARGILRTGHPVIPVTRDMDMQVVADKYPDPLLALVAVAESDLHSVLKFLPAAWHGCLGLLQNELLPRDWLKYDYINPTVISVWFEKKKGQDHKVLIPSPAFGPQADFLVDALAKLEIPARSLLSADALLDELVIKNVYILTTNICGLVTQGNVDDLWSNHQDLARTIANEVIDIQQWLTGHTFDREKLVQGMLEGINGDLQHMCMGRSAPARLARAIQQAEEAGLAVPRMREISQQ